MLLPKPPRKTLPYTPEELAAKDISRGRMSVGDFNAQYGPVVPPPQMPPGVVTADMVNFQRDPYSGLTLRSAATDAVANNRGLPAPDPLTGPLATQAPRNLNPGNIRGFVGFNPDGSRVAPGPNPGAPVAGAEIAGTVKANPWFTQPWSAGKQAEQPYWMKGFPSYGRN